MSIDDLLGNAGAIWLIVAAVLAVAELAAPGVFLVFLALSAAITGAITLAVPDLPATVQFASFAAWSVAAVLIGKRWYRDYPVASSDPKLNDRAARLIGEIVIVEQAIEGGRGRVRIGDGSWPARGPDAPIGTPLRIAAIEGGVVQVEPVEPN